MSLWKRRKNSYGHSDFTPLCSYRTIHQEKSGEERSDAGSQVAESDYDVEEEYDNDYAENYFDNGEGDDLDDLGGGGGGDDGGGGKTLYSFSVTCSTLFSRLRLVCFLNSGISC